MSLSSQQPATICAIPRHRDRTAWNGSKLLMASIERRECEATTRDAGFHFTIENARNPHSRVAHDAPTRMSASMKSLCYDFG